MLYRDPHHFPLIHLTCCIVCFTGRWQAGQAAARCIWGGGRQAGTDGCEVLILHQPTVLCPVLSSAFCATCSQPQKSSLTVARREHSVRMPMFIVLWRAYVCCLGRSFKRKAAEVRQAAERLTEGLTGRRDLAKLSPWLAEYYPVSGKYC